MMSAYKFDTLTAESVVWRTPGGNDIEVCIALVQESTDFFGNGDWSPKRGGLNITTTAKVNGKKQSANWVEAVAGHAEYTHKIGAIGLSAERNALVSVAYANVKKHAAWVAKEAQEAKSIAESREYEAHVKAVNRMMRPDGSY